MSNEKDKDNIEDKFINNFDTIVDIDIDAYIPTTYIDDEKTKLDTYKKISKCESENELKEIELEMRDRFGALST